MEIFYSDEISADSLRLKQEEAFHCIKVLRHRTGERINVMDGKGTMYKCTITGGDSKEVQARIAESLKDWGGHPYKLTMAVCPTKNMDRYEWFAEKSTEFGVDRIVPLIGERSERKILKTERLEKILLAASKQSLKAAIPSVCAAENVSEFISSCAGSSAVKLIAYCFEDERIPRRSVKEILKNRISDEFIIMIGPEGDFSEREAELAISSGFIPISLGASRLRTETAAVAAVAAVYFEYM